jgi:hypothetical protein
MLSWNDSFFYISIPGGYVFRGEDMKNTLYILGFCLAVLNQSASCGINFGSRDSGFVVGGGSLVLGSASLYEGLVRDLVGGGVSATDASCTNMTFEVADNTGHRFLNVTGTVTPGTSIVLDEYDILTLNGGRCDEVVTANGSEEYPSIIRGYGEFENTIVVDNNSVLTIAWNGQLNQNIQMIATNAASEEIIEGETISNPADECTVRLGQDLTFTPTMFFIPSGSGECSVNCNGYKIVCGGDDDDVLYIDRPITISNTNLELKGPVRLSAELYLEEGWLEGNHNIIRFDSGEGFFGNLRAFNGDVDVKNVKFEDVRSNSFAGSNEDELNLHDCEISCDSFSETFHVDPADDQSELLTVDIAPTSFNITAEIFDERSDFFVGDVQLDDANSEDIFLSLNSNLTLNGEWLLTADATVRGNGHNLIFGRIYQTIEEAPVLYRQGSFRIEEDYVLRFEDITLRDVNAAAFDTLWVPYGEGDFYPYSNIVDLYNVNWIDDSGQHIFITGHGTGAARVELPEDAAEAGDLFGSNSTFPHGAHIELRSDITVNGTWTFEDTAIINGGGATFDLNAGTLAIATNKTLTLSNMTIVNARTASFLINPGYAGEIILSNVTIVLANDAGNMEWTNTFSVQGPLMVVTGSQLLNCSAMTIEYGTAYYDTLDADDDTNFMVDTGRVMRISAAIDPETTGTITINGNATLEKNEYLFPYDDLDGRTIECIGSGVYNGHGRTLFFPYSAGFADNAAVVLTVFGGQSLVTTNMILDGLVPAQHLEFGGSLYFGHDTLVRLNQDIVLDGILRFGSNDESSSNETMILDLQGHDLNLGTGSIELYGESSDNNTLIIKNGRLLVTDADVLVVATGNTLVFENVDIVFMGTDWIHDAGNLRFEGHCRFMGDAGNTIFCLSSGSTLIADAATLTLCDGIVWSHSTTQNFSFGSSTATLELIGATFRHPDFVYNTERAFVAAGQLFLYSGKLICDHKSYIQPGAGGMYLVHSLDIQLRPGAIVTVGTYEDGGDEDSQYTSAGAVTYGAD